MQGTRVSVGKDIDFFDCATSVDAPSARGIFDGHDAVSGADICPASCGPEMPRARMVFAGRVQINAACSKALCCTLVFPIPSHDRCAILSAALFRSDVLATAPAYAATAGALYVSPFAISAHTTRAILLASATRTSIGGLRAIRPASQVPGCVSL